MTFAAVPARGKLRWLRFNLAFVRRRSNQSYRPSIANTSWRKSCPGESTNVANRISEPPISKVGNTFKITGDMDRQPVLKLVLTAIYSLAGRRRIHASTPHPGGK